ncbi:MAG TPA: PP2C family protein-serine/threonine phosphatase [Thermoleophilaceae bacterium]
MNETGRRAPGTRSRIWGTAVAAAVLLSLSAPVLAKDHPGKGVDNASVPVAAAPQAVPDKKAQKELAKAQRQAIKAQQQAAKGERQAAKAQRQAAKAEQKAARRAARLTAPSPAGGSNPLPLRAATAAPQAAAAPAATRPVARSAARRAAAHRAAARRRAAAHRRAAARRAAARRAAARRRAAATPTAATTPIAATGATPASAPPTSRKKAAAPKRNATPKPAEQPSSGGGVVTRTVRDIVHVIPGWAKALILALAALLAVAALLIAAAALRNRRLRALSKRLLEEVGTLSTALLPVIPPRIGTLAVSVAYRPAEGLAAGGDFYDVFPLDRGRVGIVVGDVSGHGRESLGPATFTRHMVRSYLEAGLAPRAALQLAGKVVDEQDRDDFATVVAAVHDPSAGTFSYATAGHPPPIITGPGAHRPIMVASSPPLGAGGPTGLRQTTVPVAPGSTVCLITDGLIDARRGDKIFGLPRVERIVRELGQDATAERLVARVAREADSMPDDVAVAVMHVEGGAATASTLRVEEIEVARDELTGARLRRFLEACGLSSDQVAVIKDAQAKAAKYGAVVLRVRLAEGRSGVDILPVQQAAAPGGELAAIHSISSS